MDSSPYIYQNNAKLSKEDIQLLNATEDIAFVIKRINSQYRKHLEKKFAYMQKMATNHSSEKEMCMAVFLTYFTTPVWTPVGCDDQLEHNHVVCEIKSEDPVHVSDHPYKHSALSCPHGYVYADGTCWSVSTKITRANTSDVQVAVIQGLLSAWSLGQSMRQAIVIQGKDKKEDLFNNL